MIIQKSISILASTALIIVSASPSLRAHYQHHLITIHLSYCPSRTPSAHLSVQHHAPLAAPRPPSLFPPPNIITTSPSPQFPSQPHYQTSPALPPEVNHHHNHHHHPSAYHPCIGAVLSTFKLQCPLHHPWPKPALGDGISQRKTTTKSRCKAGHDCPSA